MKLLSSPLLVKLSGLCLMMFLTSQNAHAFNLNIGNLSASNSNTNQIRSKLTYDNLFIKLPNLLVVEEKNVADIINEIRNKYLTFYSNKNENVKATYKSGAYFLRYTNFW